MTSLKADNSRLQTIVTQQGLGSPTSQVPPEPLEKRLSLGDPSSLGTYPHYHTLSSRHSKRSLVTIPEFSALPW
jgi:hypothetical protein